jgi:hypothetical protein
MGKRGVGITLIVIGIVVAIIALSTSGPSPQSLPSVSRFCEDAIGKVQNYSERDPDSIRIDPSPRCFGPVVRFPRTWQQWIVQETGETREDSWLAGWLDGAPQPMGPLPGSKLNSWAIGGDMRFAGKGSFLAIAITRVTPSAVAVSKTNVRVPGNQKWTATGIKVRAGDTIILSASGLVKVVVDGHVPAIPPMSPDGYQPDCTAENHEYGPSTPSSRRNFPDFDLPCWSLIGRIGIQGPIFEVGQEKTLRGTETGELYFGINDDNVSDNSGDWIVGVTVNPSTPPAPKAEYQNRVCDGAEDGQPDAISVDHSGDDIGSFTVELQPGCFSGYILIPGAWASYRMEPVDPAKNWWMAYMWYQSRNSGSGERPPLKASELLALDRHTSQKIRVQGNGQLFFRVR